MTREEREDAIDIIQSILDKYEEDECLATEITIGDEDIKAFKMAMKALEQEPKTGHWIDSSNGWMCSECNKDNTFDTNYCPNCGAKMEKTYKSGKMTRTQRLKLLKQIEQDIYVPSIESTLFDDAKSCAIHSVIEELEQEPFINKSCVSSGACEHDMNKVLDKIRAEILTCLGALDEIEKSGINIYLPNEMSGRRLTYQQCLEFIDKYKAEAENEDGEY